MSITAMASVAHSAAALGAMGERLTPAIGLAFRFTVEIDDLDLGSWQTCSGLKVDFKPVEVKSGGSYLGSAYLAGEATYPRVILKRAAVAEDVTKVQDWLQEQSIDWVSWGSGQAGSAVITLYDSHSQPVLWWQLQGVRPAAWSGPDLDASSSKLAIETLELVHEGFVSGSGKPPEEPAPATERTPLTLSEGGATVTFPYAPTEISVQKAQNPAPTGLSRGTNTTNQQSGTEQQTVDLSRNRANVTTYNLNNLILDGEDITQPSVAMLTWWATKAKATSGGKAAQPVLTLSWGEGFQNVEVLLASLTVSYTRFSAVGTPTRAKVGLKLEDAHPATAARPSESPALATKPGAANPTSGGIPGRESHLMLQSDSMPALSRASYGNPGKWREIARANDVDDPLRVAPGTTLLLPAPSETEQAASAHASGGTP